MYLAPKLNLRREHPASNQSALLQIDQRLIGLRQRHWRHRNGLDFLGSHQIEQFLRFPEIADIAALDRDGLDWNQRQCPRRAAAEQADDHQLAALGQAVEAELCRLGIADQIYCAMEACNSSTMRLLQRIGRRAAV